MMAMDIHKTRFEAVEICGIPALFTVERVRRSELPNLRGGLVTAVPAGLPYHCGTLWHSAYRPAH